MPLRDATDYQFATPGRQLLVRQAHPAGAGDRLVDAARRYEERLTDVFRATNVRVSAPGTTAGGAAVVGVTADLPPAKAGEPPGAVRTAFLRFGGGPLVEMTLHAAATDDRAAAEFDRLLASARPATPADPVAEVARSVVASPDGRAGHPAGAVTLDLTPDYHGPEQFVLASDDDTVHYRLNRAAAAEAVTRAAVTGTILGTGVGVAVDPDGTPVRYEVGPRPRRFRGGRPVADAAAEAATVFRSAGAAPAVPAPGEVVVEGAVRGTPVRVRVATRGGDAQALGEQLIRALNGP